MSIDLLDYADVVAAGPAQAGGKAWTLARLARWGFPVPPGLVVGAGGDRALRTRGDLAPSFAGAGRIAAEDLADPAALEELSALRVAILATAFSAEDRAALEDELRRQGLLDASLAVRSSATGEDGAQFSFAGMHDSVLKVRGVAAVAAAIRRCQASLWTPQAVAYRRRFGIADEGCLCAVLICRMVTASDSDEPVAAGVAFTADPRDGRRDRIVIEAVSGLGDKLVAGRVTPVRFSFGFDQWDVDAVDCPQPSALPSQAARALARLSLRLHWALGDGGTPQDIEWAFDGTGITILQARPVTVLPRPCFGGLAGQPLLWSNANLKEVLAAVPSLLTWSLMQVGVSRVLYDAHRVSGLAVPDGMPSLRRFHGRPYFDISALQWAAWDAFGLPPAEFTHLLGGAQPAIAVPSGNPLAGRDGWRRIGQQVRLLRHLWGLSRRLAPRMADIHQRARALRRDGAQDLTQPELAALGRAWLAEIMSFPISLANSDAGIWLGVARQTAARYLSAAAADGLVSRLMAGAGAVTSAEHGYRLQSLARLKAENSPAFAREWQGFLDHFGHRGFTECELANPRWGEAPSGLAALLDNLAAASRERADGVAVRREAELALAALPPLARRLVRWAAGKAQAGYALREESKSCLVAVLGALRLVAQETGRRMAAAGLLDETQAVFDLSAADVLAWLDGLWDGQGARALAADNGRQRAEWMAAAAPPDVMAEDAGCPPAPVITVAASRETGVWHGLAASPGRALGLACILDHPAEAARLVKGGILVARATDPGWTPLFLLAGGVVAETGGYLSHSAIVAREFGLPAVVNLPGIRDAVSHGQSLAVDGDRGRVERR